MAGVVGGDVLTLKRIESITIVLMATVTSNMEMGQKI